MEIPTYLQLGQEPAPDGGYRLQHFDAHIEQLTADLKRLEANEDPLAVFQLTYLTFSKQVREALSANRFHDHAFAVDMACRFVGIYVTQLELWEARDLDQCRAWRVAFERMERGEVNVLQAMLLGMNAHINFDLAFCTLGACRQAGDRDRAREAGRLAGVRGIPATRYADFLLINRVGWESVPLIQETVLGRFNRWLWFGNRLVASWTQPMGERLLLGSREAAWRKTMLLLHARDDAERGAVARLIDAEAEGGAELVGALTWNPLEISEAWNSWGRRGRRVAPELAEALLAMAHPDSPVVDQLLQELAFSGADPRPVLRHLNTAGNHRLAALFAGDVMRSAPDESVKALVDDLTLAGAGLDAVLDHLDLDDDTAWPDAIRSAVRERRTTQGWQLERWLAAPEVNRCVPLASALRRDRMALGGDAVEAPVSPCALEQEDRRRLLVHPDPWIRLCAALALKTDWEPRMQSVIDRVLFLKETPLFIEVEATDLLRLAESVQERQYDDGAIIVGEGSASAGLQLIVSGEVHVSQQRGAEVVPVARLGRGDALGELSLLQESPATADCIASGSVTTLNIEARAFGRLLQYQPRLALGMMRVLAQRLSETTRHARS